MRVCVSSQLRRFALRCSLTVAIALTTASANAGDAVHNSEIDPFTNTCNYQLDTTEDLCGWGGYRPMGTHDSGALPTPAPEASIPPAPVVSRMTAFDKSIDESVTAIATAALATAGISVEQIVEPFAMVGPYLDDSVEGVRDFQEWWSAARVESLSVKTKTATEAIQDEIDQIAAQEPIDVESYGPSVVVEQLPALQAALQVDEEQGVQVAAISVLVGSSPIIATIEESYQPYDLAARDLKLWSVFPTSRYPFCIRSHTDPREDSLMWQEFDEVVVRDSEGAASVAAVASDGSADRLLGKLIESFDTLVAEDSVVSMAIKPQSIGRKVAELASHGNRVFQSAAQLLAMSWPEAEATEVDEKPSRAGEALLARAGAIDASEPAVINAAAEAQITEVPSGTSRR